MWWSTAGAALNVVAASVVLWVALRNFKVHADNVSMVEKIAKNMRLMKQLRDLLADELDDPSTVGDAHKEGKYGIH